MAWLLTLMCYHAKSLFINLYSFKVIPLKYDELSPLRMQWAHSYWYPLGDYGVKGKPI